jgi:hypothetical protein
LNERLARLAVLLDTPQSRVVLVDQFTAYRPGTMMQSDGLHPNTLGEATMATNWFDALVPVLQGALPPRPSARLGIRREAGSVILSWPVAAGPYSLETAGSLAPASWSRLTNGLASDGMTWTLTNAIESGPRFYRLSLD